MINIKGSGSYINGTYIKEQGITELKIENEAKVMETDFGEKVECKVSYKNQVPGGPDTWTMNNTSARLMSNTFGNDSKDWIGKTIPVEPSRTEKGYAIYLDESKLAKGTLD